MMIISNSNNNDNGKSNSNNYNNANNDNHASDNNKKTTTIRETLLQKLCGFFPVLMYGTFVFKPPYIITNVRIETHVCIYMLYTYTIHTHTRMYYTCMRVLKAQMHAVIPDLLKPEGLMSLSTLCKVRRAVGELPPRRPNPFLP